MMLRLPGQRLTPAPVALKISGSEISVGIDISQRDLNIFYRSVKMDLQITGQSIEILPTVKDYIEKKV